MNSINPKTMSISIFKLVLLISVILLAQASIDAQAPPFSEFCAKEGEHCDFYAATIVKYGANGIYAAKKFTYGTDCNVAAFGYDPVPNVVKQCFIEVLWGEEKVCFHGVQNKVDYDAAGNTSWNESNIIGLCRGSRNAVATITCFKSKMPAFGWKKASDACRSNKPQDFTSLANVNYRNPPPSPPAFIRPRIEEDCFNLAISKIPLDTVEDYARYERNFRIACRGTKNPTATMACFTSKISPKPSDNWETASWACTETKLETLVSKNVGRNAITYTVPRAIGIRDFDIKKGAFWAIGFDQRAGGFGIYKQTDLGLLSGLMQIDGAAVRIAVDNNGNPWVINSNGAIYKRINDVWTAVPGPTGATPLDIAITNAGEVWIVRDDGSPAHLAGSRWVSDPSLSARKIIFTPNPDTLQVIDKDGKRFTRESATSWVIKDEPSDFPDYFLEYAVGEDGTKWAIDSFFTLWNLGGGGQTQPTAASTPKAPSTTLVQPSSPAANALSGTRTITFRNEAGFVAKMMIQYFEAGPNGVPIPKFLFTDNIPVGQNRTLEIPNSAPNMQVTVSLIGSGAVKDNFFSTSLDAGFTGNRCFKAWGTLFSPQGGPCQ